MEGISSPLSYYMFGPIEWKDVILSIQGGGVYGIMLGVDKDKGIVVQSDRLDSLMKKSGNMRAIELGKMRKNMNKFLAV